MFQSDVPTWQSDIRPHSFSLNHEILHDGIGPEDKLSQRVFAEM